MFLTVYDSYFCKMFTFCCIPFTVTQDMLWIGEGETVCLRRPLYNIDNWVLKIRSFAIAKIFVKWEGVM